MIIKRKWCMPNKNTFSIAPIKEIIYKYYPVDGLVIDPFANSNKIANITNDIDESFETNYHLDATDFLKLFDDSSVDMVLYDPPYSSRQISECYRKNNLSVNMETTQSSYWKKHKEQIARIVKGDGIVITFAWNSGGIGTKYRFKIEEILLVPHGGWHNDTIVTVERKIKEIF
jgi:DNA modification methylase